MATKRNIDSLGLEYALRFTAAYKKGSAQNIYERESLCEDVQFPAVLVGPGTNDLLCGKRLYPEVGYSPQYGGMGYYFDPTSWEGEELLEWKALKEFWSVEATEVKCRKFFSPEIKERLGEIYDGGEVLKHPAYPLFRMAGLQLDYQKLVEAGIGGLEAMVEKASMAARDDEAAAFYKAVHQSIQRIRRCAEHYLYKARKLSSSEKSDKMMLALAGLLDHAPKTFHEGLQLVLLVQTMTGTINFGRLDTVLGPLLVSDLEKGWILRSEALELMRNFYTILDDEILHFDARIIIGGMGRSKHEAADQFAMLAMEATDSLSLPMPQLTLRFHDGQDPALLEKAFEVIGHGKTFPMLYNDEVNVPAVEKAFHVDRRTAEQYLPFGCGEYMIEKRSCGTPNFIINLQRCLELAMNNGRCIREGEQRAPDYGNLSDFSDFSQLWRAYEQTVSYFLEVGAQAQNQIYEVTGRECPYSLISLLYDDCIDRGRSVFSGGLEFLGGTNETYGNSNTADSLTAMNELIFKGGKYSGSELMEALGANWEGFEVMHKAFKEAPKFGNDHNIADSMAMKVHDHVCLSTSAAAEGIGLHHFLVVIINNNHNTLWGKETSASPDGRKHGEPLAPGNTAGAGFDCNGLTALLNSQAKADPSIHAGAVHNVMLSSGFPEKNRSLYHALFRGYFKQGGTQTMITVCKRDDLLAALENPQNYANLLVRVGGFSARFIDLDRATQQEILTRTEHQA